VSVTVAGTDCTIQLIKARIHDELRLVGDVKGTSLEFTELHENTPKIVFRLSDFGPANESYVNSGFTTWKDILAKGTIVRAEDEDGLPLAYEITDREPVHGITINVNVTRVSDRKACTFPLPEVPETCPVST